LKIVRHEPSSAAHSARRACQSRGLWWLGAKNMKNTMAGFGDTLARQMRRGQHDMAPTLQHVGACRDFGRQRIDCRGFANARAGRRAARTSTTVEMLKRWLRRVARPCPTMSTKLSRSGTSTFVANSPHTLAAPPDLPDRLLLERNPTVSASDHQTATPSPP